MNSIFSDMLDENLLFYLDNLLVFSVDIELHYDDICKALEQLCKYHLKAKGSKCEFVVTKVEYLGHILENRAVAMDPEKIHTVVYWTVPILIKQLLSFLGFANHYNRFIKGCSTITALFTEFLKKNTPFVWDRL